jgi:Transposase
MDVIHERCCGLDIHKKTVVACLIMPGPGGPVKEIRSFGTMTDDLLALADWLAAAGCTIVGMESTGVYWNRHAGPARTAQHESPSVLPSIVRRSGCRPRVGLVPRARLEPGRGGR